MTGIEKLHLPEEEEIAPAVRSLRLWGKIAALFVLFILIPVLSSLGIMEDPFVNRLGRYLCFAICAIGIDLAWGYTGILGLCQAMFFTLGGYAMAMHLSLPQGGGDVRAEYNSIPQFFFFNNVETLPKFWEPFTSLPFALVACILIPTLIGLCFGFFVFRSKVKGVYFTIITQAIAWGAYLIFCRNELLLGGTNGLTNFYKGLNQSPNWIIALYLISAFVLVLVYILAKKLTLSRLGRLMVAVRDKQMLLNFIGYRASSVQLFAFTISAFIAGIGGMLYVPQNGIITPNIMRVEDSIWMVIWVALGGRGNLWGAIIGALLTNFAFSILTSDLPSVWPFIQGGMFLAVVLMFPDGISGLWKKFEKEHKLYATPLWRFGFVITVILIGCIILCSNSIDLSSSIIGQVSIYFAMIALTLIPLGKCKEYSGLALLGVLIFFMLEALGLMPDSVNISLFDIPIKYIVFILVLLYPAIMGYRAGKATEARVMSQNAEELRGA